MRAVVQRVKQALVRVDGEITGQIHQGLLVYLGVAQGDTETDVGFITKKIIDLRIFPDEEGKMNLNVGAIGGQILLVSQFTLMGDCRKGRRPSFAQSADPELAKRLYEKSLVELQQSGLEIQTGIFAADMDVESINDGPVTFLLDSRKVF